MLILSLQFKVTWDFKRLIPTLSFAKKLHPRPYTQGKKEGTDYRDRVKEPKSLPSPLKGSLHEHKRCCCRDPMRVLTLAIKYNYPGFSPTFHFIKSPHVLLPRGHSCSLAQLWSGLSQAFLWDLICFCWQAGFPSDQPLEIHLSPHCTSRTRRGQAELPGTGQALWQQPTVRAQDGALPPIWSNASPRSCHRGLVTTNVVTAAALCCCSDIRDRVSDSSVFRAEKERTGEWLYHTRNSGPHI